MVHDSKLNSRRLAFNLVFIIVISIFLSEVLVMVLLRRLPPLPLYQEIFLDSTLLVVFSSPFLYFLCFRPLILLIEKSRRIEEELREHEKDIEEVMKKRTEELEEARIMAVAASRAKSEFLSNMSHELRTPLNVVMGFSDLMLKGITGELTDKQKEYLTDIYSSSEHLLSLIEDMLDMSALEIRNIELNYEDMDISELVRKTVKKFEEKIERQNLKLVTEVDNGIIKADSRRLRQVLSSLLSNAVKFTPEGGAVSVRARRVRSSEFGVIRKEEKVVQPGTPNAERDRDFIEISVKDTGIGIKNGDMPKLFKPFQQVDQSYDKMYQGAGIGLALCRYIVEAHGGRIWVESTWGEGSRFVFTIPSAPPVLE